MEAKPLHPADQQSGSIELLIDTVELLDHLNQTCPDLATDYTRDTVKQWRSRLAQLPQGKKISKESGADPDPGPIDLEGEAVDMLDHLNQVFPNLATDFTRETVAQWRTALEEFLRNQAQDEHSKSKKKEDLEQIARDLLKKNTFEDTRDLLAVKHATDLSPQELAKLVGEEAYKVALLAELREYQSNAISFEQTARLWNEVDRPALGQQIWSAQGVAFLIE